MGLRCQKKKQTHSHDSSGGFNTMMIQLKSTQTIPKQWLISLCKSGLWDWRAARLAEWRAGTIERCRVTMQKDNAERTEKQISPAREHARELSVSRVRCVWRLDCSQPAWSVAGCKSTPLAKHGVRIPF